jgi:hypothetical protein
LQAKKAKQTDREKRIRKNFFTPKFYKKLHFLANIWTNCTYLQKIFAKNNKNTKFLPKT